MTDEIEKLASEIHGVYCIAYEKRFGKPFFTGGDYAKLDEPTKDYNRALAKWHIEKMNQQEAMKCEKPV